MANRMSGKLIDGSLSDTQTYAEVKQDYGTYAMWLKHSNTASSRLSDGDYGLEHGCNNGALSLGGSPAASRSHKILMHYSPNASMSRLNRSNSIR